MYPSAKIDRPICDNLIFYASARVDRRTSFLSLETPQRAVVDRVTMMLKESISSVAIQRCAAIKIKLDVVFLVGNSYKRRNRSVGYNAMAFALVGNRNLSL